MRDTGAVHGPCAVPSAGLSMRVLLLSARSPCGDAVLRVWGCRLGLSCSRVSCANSGATGRSRSGWTCSSSAGKRLVGARCDAAAAAACLEENNLCKRPWKPPASSVDTHTAGHHPCCSGRQPRCNSLPPICVYTSSSQHRVAARPRKHHACTHTHTRNSSCACTHCRHLAQQAAGLHPVVVRYDPCVAVTAGLRRPGRFARFLSSQPDLMGPQVR